MRRSGRAARPLVGTRAGEHGRTFWRLMFGGGLALPWLLQSLMLLLRRPQMGQRGKIWRGGFGLIISIVALIGGYFLRRTLIDAGHASGRDARTTLWNARR